MATQQKGIEDYRNAVKLLKLKVIKLQKLNEELNEKLREQGVPLITDDNKTQGGMTNQNSMQAFSKSCKRLGLSPEMLFRASDISGTGSIKVEDFRLFISKVRLGLNQAQITLIVRIMDEDCSGVLNKDEYYDCLQAYGINEEKSTTGTRTYGQTSLLKFSKLLLQIQISPEDSWTKMDPQNKETVIPQIFSNFVHAVDGSGSMNEKEIVATFNHIDLDKKGTIQKIFYEQEVRKGMKASAQDLGIQTSNVFTKTQQSFIIPASTQNTGNLNQLSVGRQQTLLAPQAQSMDQGDQLQQSMVMVIEEKRMFDPNMPGLKAINSKLQSKGINILDFIKELMDKLTNPAAGVMLYDVYKEFKIQNKNVDQKDQLQFFQMLDIGSNGSIDYDELMIYYMIVKSETEPFDGLLKILARKLQADEIDIGQYLSNEQVYSDKDDQMDPESFFPIAEILFSVPNRQVSDALFKFMDKDQQGTLSAQEIMETVQVAVDFYIPPIPSVVLTKPEILKNLNEYQTIIQRLKPTLTKDDFFDSRSMRGEQLIKKKWKTILNSDVACLKYCYDLVEELEKTPGTKWSDPEFGSTPTDQYGSKSMYFADNDIAKGCPEPKDVQWLRPEEVIATLVSLEHEQYEGKSVEMFSGGNASANDVVQSMFLGNCWFVSALSIIAGHEKYLQGDKNDIAGMQLGVYPPCFQFLVKYGIFVMRFYKNFGWRYVVIDDRLAFKDGEFVYGKCRSATTNWVNLIEKAYAKIHNCYDALTSGDIAQGLADMSGLAADKTKFDYRKMVTEDERNVLWNKLVEAKKRGTMMGCSAEGGTEATITMNGEDTGIMSGHAYSVIDVFELKDQKCKNYHKSHRLLRLRNPWGHGEWRLKWSEDEDHKTKLNQFISQIDTYYDEQIKEANRLNLEPPERYKSTNSDGTQCDDGEFIICYKDWRKLFCNLFQCIKFPDAWSGSYCRDKFGIDTSGVPKKTDESQISFALKNPQYIFEIDRKGGVETEVFIQMKQLDGRLFKAEKFPYMNIMRFILVCVFKLEKDEPHLKKYDGVKKINSSNKVDLRREVVCDTQKLANGRYAIIPCTKDPGESADFSINVYYDCKHEEIKFSKRGDTMFKFDIILAEEEGQDETSNDMQILLKKQAQDVIAYQAKQLKDQKIAADNLLAKRGKQSKK